MYVMESHDVARNIVKITILVSTEREPTDRERNNIVS